MITFRKVGGLRFLRVARLQVSWCICRRKPAARKLPTWHEAPFYRGA
jgi:hypothetical protein